MNKLRLMWVAVLSLLMLNTTAQLPDGYYDAADGKKSEALLDALFDIIKDHKVVSYAGLEPYYQRTDYIGDSIWDMYSTCHFTMAEANKQQKAVCDGWNKEHSIPQSWFGEASPMKSDLFHVYPTDARVNGFRSNNPYGEVNGKNGTGITNNTGNHALGKVGANTFSGYSGTVFEPADQYKGDFARTYFYMVARYRDRALNKSQGSTVFTASPTNLTTYAKNLFLKWHRQDPVSQKEISRNDSVYAIQNNRNPFIDYPYLVEYIWGSESGNAADFLQMISSSDPEFIPGESDGYQEATDPRLICSTQTVTFPTVKEGETADYSLQIQGVRLTDDITLALSGADAACFAVEPATIALADIQAQSKQTVKLTYLPKGNAVHKAVLTIASEGANTLQVALSGACAVECEVIWLVNCEEYNEGDPTTAVPVSTKISKLPSAPKSCSETSTQFVGWTKEQIDGATDEMPEDLFSDIDDSPIIIGNTIFYAVFSRLTQTGSDTPEQLVWTPDSHEGWTDTNVKANGSYHILVDNAEILSPEVDLSTLDKVVINMRTYGGTNYGTVIISAAGKQIGKLEAESSTLGDYTWTNGAELEGISALSFTSNTTTKKNGPGIARITIYSAGLQYTYDQYITSCGGKCEDDPVEPQEGIDDVHVSQDARLFIHDGQLYILSGDHVYNIMGQQIR